MSQGVSVARPVKPEAAWLRFFSPSNRYLSPLLISCVLLVGQLSYGILESYTRTLLAIATSLIAEAVLSRIYMGKWPNLASAYISGISVGILVRSPAFWPYALCALISITSKYVLARPRSPYLESIQLRHRSHVHPGLRNRGWFKHPVGQLYLAHDRDLDVGIGNHLSPAPLPYQRHLRPVLPGICPDAQLDHRRPLAF